MIKWPKTEGLNLVYVIIWHSTVSTRQVCHHIQRKNKAKKGEEGMGGGRRMDEVCIMMFSYMGQCSAQRQTLRASWQWQHQNQILKRERNIGWTQVSTALHWLCDACECVGVCVCKWMSHLQPERSLITKAPVPWLSRLQNTGERWHLRVAWTGRGWTEQKEPGWVICLNV